MSLFRWCYSIFIFCVVMGMAVSARSSDITVYKRDLYDRIVVENATAGDVEKKDNVISLPYKNNIDADIAKDSRTLRSSSQSGNQTILTLNKAVTDIRHFKIGRRIILDIFFDADKMVSLQKEKRAQEIAQKTKQREEQKQPQSQSEDHEKPSHNNTEEKALEKHKDHEKSETTVIHDKHKTEAVTHDKDKGTVDVVKDEPPQLKESETSSELAQATIVTVSSTRPFGLSAFQRFDRLIVVTDQSDMAIPPQISGHGSGLGWVMKEIPMSVGKAWMMPLPEGSYVRPEGRGLIWRLVISDRNPQLETSDIRRVQTDPQNPKIDIAMEGVSKLLRLTDPDYKDDLAVVTVGKSSSRMMIPYDFIDFNILPAEIGIVVKPESDGMRIQSTDHYVSVSNTNGLTLATDSQDEVVQSYAQSDGSNKEREGFKRPTTSLDRIFYFSDWGGEVKPHNYLEKRQELDQFLAMSPKDNKLGILLDLVKLTLSQGMGQEALGYLKLAKSLQPQIAETSEYQALRGAAHFLAHQYDQAIEYFSQDGVKSISETQLWLASAHAALGQDDVAMELYNDNGTLASIYPHAIKQAVIAPLALAGLNENQGEKALGFIALLDKGDSHATAEDKATIAYLKGRAQSVTGRPDEAISNLYKASMGSKLGPYGIRSELLLIQDEFAREVITSEDAIKRMERLRFAWRGDELEADIYKALGRLYIQADQPRKGLSILKRAATNVESVKERRALVREMADAYKSLFIGDRFEETDPMVAVAVYDEFKELTPIGDEGNQLIDRLADKLMSISMMSRATTVLKDKMDRLGDGQHAIKTGLRIAAIQLLDREPEEALKTLATVDKMMSRYRGEDKDDLNSKIVLLKARSFADTGESERALFMTEGLDDTDDVIRLRIDTAWKTSNWMAVTDNLSKLLARENITLTNPPTAEQAQLILNQAVALSLSNQYDALQRFASAYDVAMKQTPNYKTFQLITRPQNISNLADRDTLLEVTSEVDLFQSFLEKLEK